MKKIITHFMLLFGLIVNSQAQIGFPVGTVAPDFTVKDEHGVTQTLYQYTSAGKYVLIDFFAYWCGPCKLTAPIIDQFYKKYGCNGNEVVVLGIEYEGSAAQLSAFNASCTPPLVNAYPSANGLAPGNAKPVHKTYGATAYPTVCLIGPDNKVVNSDIWPISSVADLEAAFPAGKITPHACSGNGINDSFALGTVSVYPNPAVNSVTIASNSAMNISSVKIFNVLGSVVINQKVTGTDKFNLNISGLEGGVYFVEITVGNEKVTTKFIKE